MPTTSFRHTHTRAGNNFSTADGSSSSFSGAVQRTYTLTEQTDLDEYGDGRTDRPVDRREGARTGTVERTDRRPNERKRKRDRERESGERERERERGRESRCSNRSGYWSRRATGDLGVGADGKLSPDHVPLNSITSHQQLACHRRRDAGRPAGPTLCRSVRRHTHTRPARPPARSPSVASSSGRYSQRSLRPLIHSG